MNILESMENLRMSLDVYTYRQPGIASGAGKFVIARRAYGVGEGIVIFSDYARCNQHRDIVALWQREKKMAMFDVGLSPSGGGMWRLLDDGATLCLHGRSQAYGGFDEDVMRRELRVGSVFGEKSIAFAYQYDALEQP